MRVFVTGASGYVGGAVARALLRGGHAVTGLARSDRAAAALEAMGARPLRGELDEPSVLEAAARDHEASVHCAADHGDDRVLLERAAAEALIAGARASSRPHTVVITSGVWTLGPAHEPRDEESPLGPTLAVSAHRPELEREVLERADDTLATAVVRPGMLWGGRAGIAGFLASYIPKHAGVTGIAHIGDGANRWMPIHHDDCGELYRAIVERRARGMFHAVEEEPVRVADAARALADAAGLCAPHAWPLDAARAKLGPIADALAADIPARARRARELGWAPTHLFSRETRQAWNDFKGE